MNGVVFVILHFGSFVIPWAICLWLYKILIECPEIARQLEIYHEEVKEDDRLYEMRLEEEWAEEKERRNRSIETASIPYVFDLYKHS